MSSSLFLEKTKFVRASSRHPPAVGIEGNRRLPRKTGNVRVITKQDSFRSRANTRQRFACGRHAVDPDQHVGNEFRCVTQAIGGPLLGTAHDLLHELQQ